MLKNSLNDIAPSPDKLFGLYRGIVEDNNDPLSAGRLRIRVFGIHSSNVIKTEIDGIPVNELPWSEPAQSVIEGAISGLGVWNIPVQGSQVMVFFDHGNILKPVYFASMPGIPKIKPSSKEGFSDPNGEYPSDELLEEPDLNRLARGITDDTCVDEKNNNRETGIDSAITSWDEPVSPYKAVYPHNTVVKMHGGHVVELDSTPNEERFHLYHPSNTYIEIDKDGNMVIKNTKDKFEIVIENKKEYIKKNSYKTINEDCEKKIGGNEDTKTDGNWNVTVAGITNIKVTGACNLFATIVNIDGAGPTGGARSGSITQQCMCSFTGLPHPDASTNVNVSK